MDVSTRLAGVVATSTILWMTSVHSADTASRAYYYADMQSPYALDISVSADAVESHRRTEKNVCKADASLHCIETAGFRFAVPKTLVGQREWTVGTARYRVIGQKELFLYDSFERALLIRDEQTNPKNQLTYLFSPRRGLIAFWHSMPGTPSFFAVQVRCGFAASPDCGDSDRK